jgi:DNA-binding beta-propeller fold protein YncE
MSTWCAARLMPAVMLVVIVQGGPLAGGPERRSVGGAADPGSGQLFTLRAVTDDLVIVDWDREAVRAAARRPGRRLVQQLSLHAGLTVDLDIEPFSITGPASRFVLGRADGPDEPLDFDPASVSMFRGHVIGHPGSHVFLALSDILSSGYVDLGSGRHRYRIASALAPGDELPPGQIALFETGPPPSRPPDVPFCSVEPGKDAGLASPSIDAATGPIKGLKHLELAVETDYEFFVLFEDATAAMTYLTAMYGEVSDIYVRDVDTRVELVFARLWDDPNDLFNNVDPSPLSDFQSHWNSNMGHVARDVAQLFSGRRDYPFGGQAYLSSLCNSNAYSVVGYALGFFPDPSTGSPYNYDIAVTGHEIGHNCGTGHTHDIPNLIDTCDDPQTTAQRGTIMSYCGQTWSGGNGNRDLYFHSTIQGNMDAYLAIASCVVDDCNQNGVADATDISGSTSDDLNSNGIPDECEDCNGNLVLDDTDIVMGTSLDLNANTVPDECEPDCNGNNVPDDKDIADATSADVYGNDIPDECEADCDTSSVSDYTQIQADMTLDVDRDAVLDSCQDCDGDGTTDFDALDGSHDAWVASGLASSRLRQMHGISGVLTLTSGGNGQALVDEGQDLIVAPGGNILVTNLQDDRVMEFAPDGDYLGNLVSAGSGGLTAPAGMTVTPDQATLLVASSGTDSVLAYDATTGASAGAFVAAGSGGLSGPFGLIFRPGGNLFVTSDTNEVYEYDSSTGAFVGVFVSAAANGGLDQPRGIAFKPDGNLLVASFGTDEVLEFDGQTGAPMGKWAQVGTATRLTQVSPWGIRIGPNGNVFVVRTGEDYGSAGGAAHHEHLHEADQEHGALHLTNAQIYEFDARNGNFLRTYVGGNDHGLLFPTGFDFVPGFDVDCNLSKLPDSCDIALGLSDDLDADGTPDECEVDCNTNGVFDRLDIIPYGPSLDCNGNLSPDACDIDDGVSQDCTGNGVPDECEIDCNANGVADSCDVDAGTSEDCNENGIPDECDVTDDFESDLGWTAGDPGDTATAGIWTRVDPNGTAAQPEDDHTPGVGTVCFVTGQGTAGGGVGENDVDGGKTTLLSPVYDLSADSDVELSYWRWFSNNAGSSPNEDVFVVEISDDGGGSWTTVETVGPTGAEVSGGWFLHQFRVADFVTPTTDVVLRFVAEDAGAGSIVEAAVDDLAIVATCCAPPPEVDGLLLSHAGQTQLAWADQGGGAVYDVVSGYVSELRPSQGVDDAQCQADDLAASAWDDLRADPAAGEGYYYLVRAVGCAAGTYGAATPGAERLPTSGCP